MRVTYLSFLLVGLTNALPRKLYPIVNEITQGTPTVDVTEINKDLGSCKCDLTAGSCDAYCCCDQDCGQEILDLWNEQSNEICAKNYIG